MTKCKIATFSYGTVLCAAGLNKKPLPMTVRKAWVGTESKTFVRLTNNETWLCKAVTGKVSASHSAINRTTLMTELLEHVGMACDGLLGAECDPVVTAENEDPSEDDPMNEIDAGDPSPATTPKGSRKRPRSTPDKYQYVRNKSKNKVVVVDHRQVPIQLDPQNEKNARSCSSYAAASQSGFPWTMWTGPLSICMPRTCLRASGTCRLTRPAPAPARLNYA